MLVTIYNIGNTQKIFTIHHSIIKKLKLKHRQSLKIKMKEISFIVKISINKMDDSKFNIGRITIPKNIVDYLKLKHMKKIDIKIK